MLLLKRGGGLAGTTTAAVTAAAVVVAAAVAVQVGVVKMTVQGVAVRKAAAAAAAAAVRTVSAVIAVAARAVGQTYCSMPYVVVAAAVDNAAGAAVPAAQTAVSRQRSAVWTADPQSHPRHRLCPVLAQGATLGSTSCAACSPWALLLACRPVLPPVSPCRLGPAGKSPVGEGVQVMNARGCLCMCMSTCMCVRVRVRVRVRV